MAIVESLTALVEHPLAAAYATGLARGTAPFDSKKRTAAMVCETFLEQNGCRLCVSDEELVLTFFGVAAGRVSEGELGRGWAGGWGKGIVKQTVSSFPKFVPESGRTLGQLKPSLIEFGCYPNC